MNLKQQKKSGWQLRDVLSLSMFAFVLLSMFEPAFAGGGAAFQKATDTVNELNTWIIGVTAVIVTIAFVIAGWKVMFGGASMRDVVPLFAGGALIGIAGTAATFFTT